MHARARSWMRAAAALGVSGMAAGALMASPYAPSSLGRRAPHTSAVALCDGPAATTPGGARLISGKKVAEEIRAELKAATERLKREHGVTPGLAVVLVGDRPDSASYVRSKKKMAESLGYHSVDRTFAATASEQEVLECVHALNADPSVHAILVQLPLPKHIDEHRVVSAVAVEKDVDGFSAANIGNLALRGGVPPLAVPCTPAGCVELLQRTGIEVSGKEAVVLGRSNIVGMPVAQLLQSMDATVTVCHSRTKDIAAHVKRADIVIAAIGKREFVPGEWLKPGAVVIDVGINSKEDPSAKRGYRLVGDVDFDSAQKVAGARARASAGGARARRASAAPTRAAPAAPSPGAITPVPGGVGPMTIVMLMKNTLNLARHSVGLERLPLRRAPTNKPPQ